MFGVEKGKEAFHPKEDLICAGKVLYLTQDSDLIRFQLEGNSITEITESELLDNISTDEILPNKAALAYSGREVGHLGNHALTGLKGGVIKPGDLMKEGFSTLVAGNSFARGSSRIHAPLALKEAGIRTIIANAERIFSENCVNTGIYIVDSESTEAKRLLSGHSINLEEIIKNLSPQAKEIIRAGGLLSYLREINDGNLKIPEYFTKPRPMTIAEKIVAKKVLKPDMTTGLSYVMPGQEYIVIPDKYYGYELQSSAVINSLKTEFGDDIPAKRPDKVSLDNDHTALLSTEVTQVLRDGQADFARKLGITVYEADPVSGAPAICHTRMLEGHALPGELILGNDSHTCTVGSLNTLAVGKGAIDLAGAIAFDQMTLKVPETIRINLRGKLPAGVTTKDFMLQFGAMPQLKADRIGSGRVFEFGGEALGDIPFDEQIKLTNLSIELLGFTGVIEPNSQMLDFLKNKRGLSEEEVNNLTVKSDEDAQYSHVFDIDLSTVEQTVSEPGDTQNGRPLSEIKELRIKPDKIYIGSCTHGTVGDLEQAASILRGRKIADGVKLYVQASSINNLEDAKARGYIQELIDAGAELLPIGCGACMNAGPGSTEDGEIGLFATNRNFPGRTGKGETYLSSPLVAAASAIEGYICGPEDIKDEPKYVNFEGVNIQWNKVSRKFTHPESGERIIDTYSIWNPKNHEEIAERLANGQRCAIYMMGTFGVGEYFSDDNSNNFRILDNVKQRERAQNLVIFANPAELDDYLDSVRLPTTFSQLKDASKRASIYPGPMHAILPVNVNKLPNTGLARMEDESASFFWIPGHWGYERLAEFLSNKKKGLFAGGSLNIHGQEPSFNASELIDREMSRHPEWIENIDFIILDEISEASNIGRSHTQISFMNDPASLLRIGSLSKRKAEVHLGHKVEQSAGVKKASSKTAYTITHDTNVDIKVEIALARIARYKNRFESGNLHTPK